MIPSVSDTEQHLQSILQRGSAHLGPAAGVERLMLLLDADCELRCTYCHVVHSRPPMPPPMARRAIDLLMRSERPRLELQLFGGEPTRRWDELLTLLSCARDHPLREGRRLEMVVTTNGLGLSADRIQALADFPVVILLSMDGDDQVQRRFRPAAGLEHAEAQRLLDTNVDHLLASPLNWFVNAVITPQAAGDVKRRYAWAVRRGLRRLQLAYAVGVPWQAHQMRQYLRGLVEVLIANHTRPTDITLFDWENQCEPVMLSDELIVEGDGALLHDVAIFLERPFPRLRERFRIGHLDETTTLEGLRWPLARIHAALLDAYPPQRPEHEILHQNLLFGAAKDLCVKRLIQRLGRPTSVAT